MTRSRLVLASGSPRRRELLGRFALEFTVEPADIDETPHDGEAAEDYVERLARQKAATVARPDTVVVAADTAVVIDGDILGKPRDRAEADAMLSRLSGRPHEVVTGVCVRRSPATGEPREVHDVERTVVRVESLAGPRRNWYLGTGEADDKAGAYGLQGMAGLFADRIEGSVTNVVGLPLALLDRLFADLGLDLLDYRTEPGDGR